VTAVADALAQRDLFSDRDHVMTEMTAVVARQVSDATVDAVSSSLRCG
jgi:hypothetical protein